jgi:hypothetical protein
MKKKPKTGKPTRYIISKKQDQLASPVRLRGPLIRTLRPRPEAAQVVLWLSENHFKFKSYGVTDMESESLAQDTHENSNQQVLARTKHHDVRSREKSKRNLDPQTHTGDQDDAGNSKSLERCQLQSLVRP